MEKRMSNTERELRRLIEAAGFEAITVTMKCNGDRVTITPCTNGGKASSFDDIDYYLIDSPSVNLCGSERLGDVASTLLRYKEELVETENSIEALKEYIRTHTYESDWGYVSDWHKDLFGHRPHVGEDRLIRWAFNSSKNSARFE